MNSTIEYCLYYDELLEEPCGLEAKFAVFSMCGDDYADARSGACAAHVATVLDMHVITKSPENDHWVIETL